MTGVKQEYKKAIEFSIERIEDFLDNTGVGSNLDEIEEATTSKNKLVEIYQIIDRADDELLVQA